MSLIADIAAYSNPFGTPSKGKWNLSPGTWIDSKSGVKTVFFAETRAGDDKGTFTALEQITDTGKRRLAVYEYPYLDGQRLKDLGRKGETYTFNIKFFGPNYQQKYREFYNQVYRSNSIGILSHPTLSAVRGAVYTRLESFEPVHRAGEYNSVTIKAVFVEDNSSVIDLGASETQASPDTALQRSLNNLVSSQAKISAYIASASATLQLPSAVAAGLNARKNSLLGQVSSLLGQLGATFSSKSDLIPVLTIAAGSAGGVTDVSSGAVVQRTSSGTSELTKLPPVFQVGLDANTQILVESQQDAFVNANQVTSQQAMFGANQSRSAISAAIQDVEAALGNFAYDIVVEYRSLAVNIQETVEACITSAQSKVRMYTVPRPMSLRMIAFANGLDPDRQNDIEQLNPYLPSVNFIAAGSVITVPAA